MLRKKATLNLKRNALGSKLNKAALLSWLNASGQQLGCRSWFQARSETQLNRRTRHSSVDLTRLFLSSQYRTRFSTPDFQQLYKYTVNINRRIGEETILTAAPHLMLILHQLGKELQNLTPGSKVTGEGSRNTKCQVSNTKPQTSCISSLNATGIKEYLQESWVEDSIRFGHQMCKWYSVMDEPNQLQITPEYKTLEKA